MSDKPTAQIKYMDVKEFREKGYLQELNRTFLHPLGLALEVVIEEDGTERLGKVWDYRDDREGIYYDLEHSSQERLDSFREKMQFIDNEWIERCFLRYRRLGFDTEPIPKKSKIDEELWDADPNCDHELDERRWSGIKCKKCGGWFCY